MSQPDFSLVASLREAYEASRAVRSPADLVGVLDGVAEIVSDQLGWSGVAIHIHRRAYDDFETVVVHCNPEARDLLLGAQRDWSEWAPLFAEPFERRGAHWLPHEANVDAGECYRHDRPEPSDPDAWHPDDMLVVLLRGTDGEVTGIMSVDEPVDGRRPTDAQIDALMAVANAAGAALQHAREAVADATHQSALKQLLAVSTRMADARTNTDVLDAVCTGISEALGFECVAVELAGADGQLVYAAGTGWETIPQIHVSVDALRRLLRPEYEQHGCYLLDHTTAHSLLGITDSGYVSKRNGKGPWAWHRHWLVVPLRDPSGELEGFIWADEPVDRLLPDTACLQTLRLFADQAQAAREAARHYEQTLHLAEHDPLTGLPNRPVLLDRLRQALRRAQRSERTVAVLFVDIDRFKAINDTHGHEVGDDVLRAVAGRIDGRLRPGDTVARIGGDEFVVLCEDVRGSDEALEVSRRIRASLAEPIVSGSTTLTVTASVGVALPTHHNDDARTLLRYADVAMYRAKDAGRDGEEIASAALREGASARAKVERALDGALERGEITLVWQPIVGTHSGRIVRAEGLLRWEHPILGHVSPLEFIPLAEENGSIVEIGRWVLKQACADWASWYEDFGDDTPGIAVNLSPRQLRDARLAEHIAALLARHSIPRGTLTIELTESSLLDAAPAVIETLATLRAMGCRVELDDFGTGYSSLASLAEFSVDGIKLDRRFVSGRARDEKAGAIAQAVLAMARALGVQCTAEGVETDEQLAWLRSRGCPEAQGYFFSRPLPAGQLSALLVTPELPAPAAV